MNWLDTVIIAALAWFTVTSLTTGIIREVLTFAGLVVGVILSGRFYTDVGERLTFIDNPDAAKISAFILIFLAVTLSAHLLAFLLQQIAHLLLLGWVDHAGGAVFGFAKGTLICELLLIAFARFPFLGMGTAIEGSRLAPLFLKSLPFLLALLPEEFGVVRSLSNLGGEQP